MPYTTPVNQSPGDNLSSLKYNNEVVGNALWFLTGRAQIYNRTAGNYTTTSTSSVAVDATNLAFTLTSAGTRVEVIVSGVLENSANNAIPNLYINLDGTDGPPLWPVPTATNTMAAGVNYPFVIHRVFTVTPGSHTYTLKWKTNSGTLTLYGDGTSYGMSMSVKEIG